MSNSPANIVQPLHRKRGRPRGIVESALRKDDAATRSFDDEKPPLSRRACYYHYAFARVCCLAVEHGLISAELFERRPRPLPLPVFYHLGQIRYTDEEILWRLEFCLRQRHAGWSTEQLLWWLRNVP